MAKQKTVSFHTSIATDAGEPTIQPSERSTTMKSSHSSHSSIDNSGRDMSSIDLSGRGLRTRDGAGTQIKPNVGRKDMRSFSFTAKNLRAAGQRRVLDLATSSHENSDEEEEEWGSTIHMPLNDTQPLSEAKKKALLRTSESSARDAAESRSICLFWYDGIAAILVILKHLITIESAVSALLSTLTTWLLFHYHADWEARGSGEESGTQSEKPSSYGKSMGFLILSFFILMPITTLLRITFQRREDALQHISKMKACAMAIYTCHATWTWVYKDETKPKLNRLEHSDECMELLVGFADTITRFLTLPLTGYPRHREIRQGRCEEELTIAAAYSLFETAVSEYGTKVGLLTERMKEYGFSASEASRVRQSERMLHESAEFLREVKLYRTPQSMNALITFFAVFGPAFYAPAFAQIGHEFGSVWFGVVYAAIISLSLTALYEAVKLMEDPFVCYITIDGIDVYEELSIVYYLQLLRARNTIFPNAHTFGTSAAPDLTASTTSSRIRRRQPSESIASRRSTRFSSGSLSMMFLSSSLTSSGKRTQQTFDDLESGGILPESEEIDFSTKLKR